MITLITGVPGSGKTLRTLELMDNEVQAGRPVWTNIEGCTLPGVMQLPKEWGGHWQDYDDGSVFVIDEVQLIWRASGRQGLTRNLDIQELEKHRHRGMDFILTTQHPTFVETHVRKLVGKHEHINRPKGSSTVGISTMDHYFDIQDSHVVRSADFTIWRHPKKYFKYYQSATIHTHGFKVPKKLMGMLAVIVILTGGGLYALSNSFILGKHEEAEVVKLGAMALSEPVAFQDQDWGNTEKKTPVLGCISSDTKCVCYASSGAPLSIDTGICLKHMEHIIPYTINTGGGGAQSAPRREGGLI